MFKVTTDIKNLTKTFDMRMESMQLSSVARAGAAATAMSEYIKVRLQQAFGNSEHFDVGVTYMSQGMFKVDIMADEIGHYIYHGTASHTITSPKAMPIGEGRFASKVNHPGTEPKRAEVDAIIQEALIAMRAGNILWHY